MIAGLADALPVLWLLSGGIAGRNAGRSVNVNVLACWAGLEASVPAATKNQRTRTDTSGTDENESI